MPPRKKKQTWVDIANYKEEQPETSWQQDRDKSLEEETKNQIKGKTKNQEIYIDAIEKNTLTNCSGPAGAGKTFIACGVAAGLLMQKKIEKIIIARPLIECGQKIGAFPGDLKEKTEPFMVAMLEALGNFLTKTKMKAIRNDQLLEICPLELMRGRTFHDSMIILDEAQNATRRQLKMFLTRFGQNSKVVVCGDHTQTDLPHYEGNTMEWILSRLDHKDIAKVMLTGDDIQRHGLIKYIIEQLGE